MSLRTRLIAILCATAAFATALALAVQDRTLARDLEAAAAGRLERSAAAVNRLVDAHLVSMLDRYRAVSGTPQLRANLEVDDPPTLAHFAEELRARLGALRLGFADEHGRTVVASGDASFDPAFLGATAPRLISRKGLPYALVTVDVGVPGDSVGRLVAIEAISAETLADWAELCGVQITLDASSYTPADTLRAQVRPVDGAWLYVELPLRAERAALRRSRILLFTAGAIALAGALLASIVLSRGLVEAMRELLATTEAIGRGNLGARVLVSRDDELGELGRAVNAMAGRLQEHAAVLGEQHEQLVAAKERAEAASRAKTLFLANVSHEIRTPMTAVLGYTDLLLSGEGQTVERDSWAGAVRRNGAHLLELIDRLLDVSRIETGEIANERKPCRLRDVVAAACAGPRDAAEAKGLRFESYVDASCPEAIATDPSGLCQLLGNLLGNAAKFTTRGNVTLRVTRAPSTGGIARLAFEVRDTGIGIAPGDRERIFEPFGQVDSSLTRRFGGVGLGLTVAKRIAASLGGRLELDSELGVGSTFRFEIDAVECSTPAPETRASAPEKPSVRARVLLAEDGPDNQRLVRALVRNAQVDLEVVENGAQALIQALASLDEGTPFDVVLMDMQMPVMDGYEATQKLREAGYAGAIVALTAHAMTGDRERCLAAGCDEYLTKPIDRARLLAVISAHVGERKPDA